MKHLLRIIAAGFAWTAVWVAAPIADKIFTFDVYKHWQFYAALVLFMVSHDIFERIGKKYGRQIKSEQS